MSKHKKRKQQQMIQQQMQMQRANPTTEKKTEPQKIETPNAPVVRQLKSIPNVMSCVLAHQTVSSTAEFKWHGQKLNAIWPEVLAFFRWTYDTYKSESQVRLYCNDRTGEWKAWAFPQKANTSMTAKELSESDEGYDRTKSQLVQFNPELGWWYWGTVHHHCSASAFQSGTDQENERSQDGMHITVGCLGSPHYDIHARLYIGGFKLTSMKLSDFWDIGEYLNDLAPMIKSMLPASAADEVAKRLMGVPPAADQQFPPVWKENIVDLRPVQIATFTPGVGSHHHQRSFFSSSGRPYCERSKPNFESDLRKALNAAIELYENPTTSFDGFADLIRTLEMFTMELTDDQLDLLDICCRNDVLPGNLADYLIKAMTQQAERDAIKEQKKLEKETKANGGATKEQVLGVDSMDYEGHPHWQGYGDGY